MITFTDRWGVVWRWDDETEEWVEFTQLQRLIVHMVENGPLYLTPGCFKPQERQCR